jgi:hypothetical protein
MVSEMEGRTMTDTRTSIDGKAVVMVTCPDCAQPYPVDVAEYNEYYAYDDGERRQCPGCYRIAQEEVAS